MRRGRSTLADPTATPETDLVRRACAPASVGAPNRLWVADLTSVATHEGWRYLVAVLDACGRRVVGWSMADHLRTDLVLDALTMALQRRQPGPGRMHRSDHGRPYTALALRRSPPGGRPGRAPTQARVRVGTLPGRLHGQRGRLLRQRRRRKLCRHAERRTVLPGEWSTKAAAQSAISPFVGAWYNTRRRRAMLG